MLIVGECLTMAGGEPAEAVAVEGGSVVEVGDLATLGARFPGARRVRVETVTPGVHEAHAHPVLWGQAMDALDLAGLRDPREVAAAVARRAQGTPPGAWIRGHGYLFDHYPDSGLLDDAAPGRPVYLESRDLHSGWASAAALALAGITATTPDPPGGEIVRLASGAPSGTLLERAAALLGPVLPPPSASDLRRGLEDLAGRGYVAVHAMAYGDERHVEWVEAMAGELPLRVWWAVPAARWRETRPGWRGDDLEVAAVKLFADGSLGSRTAWMAEPYADGSVGRPVEDIAWIAEEGRLALAAGYTLAIHCIGSRAVHEVLNVVSSLASEARRRIRLEHAQHVLSRDLSRFADLPVAVSMQPSHLPEDVEFIRRLLPGREREAFRFRDLVEAGAVLAFGSDAPVVPPDLQAGVDVAVSHPLVPEQSLSWREAVGAYTRGAALAAGWEHDGLVAPGGRADLALWEGRRLVGRVYRGRLEWLDARAREERRD